MKLNGLEKPKDLQEYMVDMCWTKVDRRNWYQKRIEVAIECEWSRNIIELEWDFAKLLDINALRKVFIYDPGVKEQKQEEIEELLNRMTTSYDHNRLFGGDQILLINMNNNDVKYNCWEITTTKKIKELFRLTKNWDS